MLPLNRTVLTFVFKPDLHRHYRLGILFPRRGLSITPICSIIKTTVLRRLVSLIGE